MGGCRSMVNVRLRTAGELSSFFFNDIAYHGILRKDIAGDVSTVRRHLQAHHKAEYRTWCKNNNFQSMLPDDIKERKEREKNNVARLKQGSLDAHVAPIVQPKVTLYTPKNLKRAISRWMIVTDQVIISLN
jgi:hypothetical protein